MASPISFACFVALFQKAGTTVNLMVHPRITLVLGLVLPTAAALKQGPKLVVELTLIFKLGIWEPMNDRKGSSSMNEETVMLIRTLRDALGDRFRGGLTPTKLALAQFPGEITRHPTRRSRHTR